MKKIWFLPVIFFISVVFLNAQSNEEIVKKAQGMGYTEEEIQKALEAREEQKGLEREEQLRRELEKRREVLEEAEKRETPSKSDEGGLRSFGYDIFNLTPRTFEPLAIGPVGPDYPISPGDEILINLWGEVNASHSLFVDREGKIFIPEAGMVIVNGLTLERLKEKVKSRLAAVYSGIRENKTYVDVSLGKLQKIKVFIVGEVLRPGGYTISGVSTLFNALYYAGGPTPKGSLRDVKLLSPEGKKEVLDLYDYLIKGERKNDPRIHNNYTIFVPPIGKQIALRGRVHRPAIYELKEDEGIEELLEIAGGLKYDAYREKIQIRRVTEDTVRKIINVNLKEIQKEDTSDFVLEDGDVVTVFSLLNREGEENVFVYGKVGNPGKYVLSPGMCLKNLILSAGGLTLPVYKLQAEVSRLIPGAESGSVELIPLDLEKIYSQAENGTNTFNLEDQDVVFTRIKPKWEEPRRVTINGEVEEPGEYPIIAENERLSSLIKRAGGLKETAYPEAARFVRREDDMGRIDINLPEILKNPNGEDDIVLEDKDEIYIPRELMTVKVTGEVMFPVSFSYEPGKNISYYIEKAGGCTEYANTDKIRLVLPSGRAEGPGKFLWFDVSSVPAGSEIVVPRAIDTGGIDWGDVIKNVSSIVSSAVMVIFVVDRLQE